MINSRSDYFKVFSGPYFKAVENVLYQLPVFIKHVPVPERFKRVLELKRSYKYYYSTDYTSFEAHFTRKLMAAVECQLYLKCFRKDKNMNCIVNTLTGVNRCRTRTGMKCKIPAKRMSGDMCTSVGNGFTNYMLLSYILHLKGQKKDEFDCLVEGDDCIVGCNTAIDKSDFANLGFTIKIERVDDPCKASFCGIVCTENGVTIRDPARHFMKFGWTNSCVMGGPSVMAQLLKAKCMSTLCECPDCPLIAEAAWYGYNLVGNVSPRWEEAPGHDYYLNYVLRPWEHTTRFRQPNPPMETRILFEEMYGVSVDNQLAIESKIRRGDLTDIATAVRFHPDVTDYYGKYVCEVS